MRQSVDVCLSDSTGSSGKVQASEFTIEETVLDGIS